MKLKLFSRLMCAMLVLSCASCKSTANLSTDAGKSPEKSAAPRLRIGLYVDRGSSGGGVFHWAELVEISPQAELHTITRGARWEKLKDFMERGGIILASGNAATPLPEHKNLKKLPADADFTRHLADK